MVRNIYIECMKLKLLPLKPTANIIFIHVMAWVIYIFYEVSIILYISPSSIRWNEILIAFSLNIIVFYTSAEYVLPKWAKNRNVVSLIFLLLTVILAYLFLSFWLEAYVFPFLETGKPPAAIKLAILSKLFIAQHLWRVSYFLGLSTGYWFAKKSVWAERKLRLLEKEHYLKELNEKELKREIAVTQLAFIKAQVNPHFLHNTLNFFYSNIYPLSKELAESILILSQMMRYTFKTDDSNGWVDLSLEMMHIENYIKLNQLRFNNNLNILIQSNGNYKNKRIMSFMLMTFVENAFKYGDLTDPNEPLIITLDVGEDYLNFFVKNKKNHENLVFESTGIGVKNIKKQLELTYMDNYSLVIDESSSLYSSNLNIRL